MKKAIAFIFLTMTLTLVWQISNVYAQKSGGSTDECKPTQPNQHCIEFLPNNYKGNYVIIDGTNNTRITYHDKKTLPLKTGTHTLIIGGYDGVENHITFEVKKGGGIAVSANKSAVKLRKRKIEFKNVEIKIDPQLYRNPYRPSPYENLPEQQNQCKNQSCTVVPNLKYYVTVYADNDEITFHVDEKGIISCITNLYAATGTGNTLQFINNLVKVTSPNYAGEIKVGEAILQIPGQIYIVPHLAIPIYIQNYQNLKGNYLFRARDFFIPEELDFFRDDKKREEIIIKFECLDCPSRTK